MMKMMKMMMRMMKIMMKCVSTLAWLVKRTGTLLGRKQLQIFSAFVGTGLADNLQLFTNPHY